VVAVEVVVVELAVEVEHLPLVLDTVALVLARTYIVQLDGNGVDLDMVLFQYLNIIIIDLVLQLIDIQRQPLVPELIIIVHQIVVFQWKFNVVLLMVMDNVVKMKQLMKFFVVGVQLVMMW
jgi:hypothetical protein